MTRSSFAILAALATILTSAVCEQPPKDSSRSKDTFVIVGMPADARPLYGKRKVVIKYANSWRFSLGATNTSTSISAATVPSQIAPGASSKALVTNASTSGGAKPAIAEQPAPGPLPAQPACDIKDPLWPTTLKSDSQVDVCWTQIRHNIDETRIKILKDRTDINTLIRDQADEQSCYVQNLSLYPNPSLTKPQARNLAKLAMDNQKNFDQNTNPTSCMQDGAEKWPFSNAADQVADLNTYQDQLEELQRAPGYGSWATPANKAADSTLNTQLSALIAEATSYSNGQVATGAGAAVTQTYSDLKKLSDTNKLWRARLAPLAVAPEKFHLESDKDVDAVFNFPIKFDPCNDWYGKGHTDSATLDAADLSVSPSTSTHTKVATNTCVPLTIASTGIGVTFLANPTYAFVAGDSTGTQVIGVTASNNQSPLYAALYNVKLGSPGSGLQHGIELFASAGAGLTTASSTTTTDFLAGLSVSLARRVLFLTPSLDFGQRNQLAPGFKLGDAKNNLTAVPTVTHWQPGFMFSITFGIAPSS